MGVNNIVTFAMMMVLINLVLGIALFSSDLSSNSSAWVLEDISGDKTNDLFGYMTGGTGESYTGFRNTIKSEHSLNDTLKGAYRNQEFNTSLSDTEVRLETGKEEADKWVLLEVLVAIPEVLGFLALFAGLAMISPIYLLVTIGAGMNAIGILFLTLLLLPLQIQGFILFARVILGRSRI